MGAGLSYADSICILTVAQKVSEKSVFRPGMNAWATRAAPGKPASRKSAGLKPHSWGAAVVARRFIAGRGDARAFQIRCQATRRELTVLGNVAYFFLEDGRGEGDSLWRTDGTASGTIQVHDLEIGGAPSWARSLTVVGGRLFFSVYNETTGAELWTSRGDADSTNLVADLRPGQPGSSPQELTAVGDVLVFAADDGEHGRELWSIPGSDVLRP
jgi:ELWxxDGT repeat protein